MPLGIAMILEFAGNPALIFINQYPVVNFPGYAWFPDLACQFSKIITLNLGLFRRLQALYARLTLILYQGIPDDHNHYLSEPGQKSFSANTIGHAAMSTIVVSLRMRHAKSRVLWD